MHLFPLNVWSTITNIKILNQAQFDSPFKFLSNLLTHGFINIIDLIFSLEANNSYWDIILCPNPITSLQFFLPEKSHKSIDPLNLDMFFFTLMLISKSIILMCINQ